MFSHREPYPRLLLVAQQRQVRIEQVVRLLAPVGGRQADDVAQHVGEGVAGVRAIGAAPGNPKKCRRTEQTSIRAFDSREDCATYLNAALNIAGNPRLMGSCLRQQEA